MMGGRDKVLAEARESFAKNDPQFATELATYLIRVDHDDRDARLLKAAAFRKLGYATVNANWRGFYLTLARALDGSLNWNAVQGVNRSRAGSAAVAAAMPAGVQLETLPPRLKAEAVLDREEAYGFQFIDTNEAFTVAIRRGIALVQPGLAPVRYATFSGPKAALGQMVAGAADLNAVLPRIQVDGPEGAARRFASYFEEVFAAPVTYYLR